MGRTFWISRAAPNHSFCVPIVLSLWNSHQIKIFAQQERIWSWIMEKWPLRGSNGGSKGVKMGSLGSNLIWALIFTKFGGKERFCKLLNNLSLDLQFFDFESPFDPQKGSNGGQMRVKSQSSSGFHQTWWEGAFLQVIKGSLMIFLIFLLWVPHLTPWRGQGGRMGVKIDLCYNINQIW